MRIKHFVLIAGFAIVGTVLFENLNTRHNLDFSTKTVPILVAAKDLDQGTKLDKIEEQFMRKLIPKESAPTEFIDDPAALKGKSLQKSIRAGSHITQFDIALHGGMVMPIDPKTGVEFEAVEIRVTPERVRLRPLFPGVRARPIVPGARVDVICVERLPNDKVQASVVLQSVLIVGVKPENAPGTENAQTVTLAVKQSEAMILARAEKAGEVQLSYYPED